MEVSFVVVYGLVDYGTAVFSILMLIQATGSMVSSGVEILRMVVGLMVSSLNIPVVLDSELELVATQKLYGKLVNGFRVSSFLDV
ncbi:MAG: hypothetical protein EBY80_06660 [Actinobacteria bacterium]|nr:hypothetical protein [Actinomycetota bacterium]